MKKSKFSEEQVAYALRLAQHRPHSSLGHLTPREFIRKGRANASRATKLHFRTV